VKDRFLIQGLAGRQDLKGEIPVNGAKNAALQALAFSLLFKDELTFKNVPEIEDVHRMCELLGGLGIRIKKISNGTYKTSVGKKIKSELPASISNKLRASIVITGPLLARTGKVHFSHPGGCVIGVRPIDIFVEGFQKMGARFKESSSGYSFSARSGLCGGEIFLRVQSVTATQTLMISAVLARGKTVIKNAAVEPEISHLAGFLNSCGAKILGAGTHTISIKGTGLLKAHGRAYTTLPDRLETGSFLILAVLAGEDITVTNCMPEHVESLIETLSYISSSIIKTSKNTIRIQNKKPLSLKAVNIKTHEYPGFPTDLQAPMTVLLTQTKGESLVFETIFEGRLNYIESLVGMGANIKMMDPHRIMVRGRTPLRGKNLESPDIRAGLAFVIAAILAKGPSVIHNVYYIDRGYERIEERLGDLGVSIKRADNGTI
jgi:UDP-N-acetylglucosamine 1-carboxyvinyltransferase